MAQGEITTPNDLIRLALKTSGVEGIGQTPAAEDTNDCFIVLNAMIAQWSRKRWLIPNLIDTAATATGAVSDTIGTGGDFDVPRPDRIEAAYVRLLPIINSSPVDLPLQIIEAHEDYAQIIIKNLQSLPRYLFYDATFPTGNVYPWPVPQSIYEIHVLTKNTIGPFAALTTAINLPPEYAEALIWNLAVRIAPMFGVATNPTLVTLAATALNVLRGANSQIPRLVMPAGVPMSGRGRWLGHGIPGYGTTS